MNTFFHWLGFTDRAYANLLDMVYLGLKHESYPGYQGIDWPPFARQICPVHQRAASLARYSVR